MKWLILLSAYGCYGLKSEKTGQLSPNLALKPTQKPLNLPRRHSRGPIIFKKPPLISTARKCIKYQLIYNISK